MNERDADLIKLMITLRDASAMIVEATNAYLEAKAPPGVKVEKVEDLFSDDLRAKLTFEAQPDAFIIRPRRYLGSEVFSKVASIVKERGGEYVSRGKESHFRIPRKAAK